MSRISDDLSLLSITRSTTFPKWDVSETGLHEDGWIRIFSFARLFQDFDYGFIKWPNPYEECTAYQVQTYVNGVKFEFL